MRKTLKVGLLSAGILLIGSTADAAEAQVAQDWTTFGNVGILNGNQVYVPIQVPVNVCGNAISILGGPVSAGCTGGASAVYSGGLDQNWNSSLNVGIANGNQVAAIASVPVNVCGNAIAILGGPANASCKGGASSEIPGDKPQHKPQHKPHYKPKASLKHDKKKSKKKTELLGLEGLLGGLMHSAAGTKDSYEPNSGGNCDLNWSSSLNIGVLNGNQVYVPAQVPIDVSGNAIGVLGSANAWSVGGASATYC